MAKAMIDDATLTSIADAIRGKTGGATALKPSEMPEAIAGIQSGSGGLALPDTIVAGDTPVMGVFTPKSTNSTTITELGISMTMPRAGTYRFRAPCGFNGMTGGSPIIHLYKNGTEAAQYTVPTNQTSETTATFDVECAAGDVIALWATSAKQGYMTTMVIVGGLIACIDWNNGFGGT